jgi:hypothetical protein
MGHANEPSRPSRRSARRRPRKDRLIQARVARDLETALKREARRRRLSVSHLIRDILEDTFHLVDGVVANVDQLVSDSVELARSVRRVARPRRGPRRAGEGAAPDDLSHVYAWNEVVLHLPAVCSRCARELRRGTRGFAGLSDAPGRPRAWMCRSCVEALADVDPDAPGP